MGIKLKERQILEYFMMFIFNLYVNLVTAGAALEDVNSVARYSTI